MAPSRTAEIGPANKSKAPAGSSTGSAVSVAAGFAPLAIGTETIGSIILPAGRAGVYAFRAGYNTVPMDGVLHLTPDLDMIGAYARCTKDLEEVASYLLDRPELLALRPGISWGEKALSVAFADIKEWKFSDEMCSSDDPEFMDKQQVDALDIHYHSVVRLTMTRLKLTNQL